jgi:kexin
MDINIKYISICITVLFLTACGGGGGQSPSSVPPVSEIPPDENTSKPVDDDGLPPVFLSPAQKQIKENHIVVMQVLTSDVNVPVNYSLEGDDVSSLYIYNNGTLVFQSNPDYEAPKDSNGDNLYQVKVKATDAKGNSSYQDINITVTDIADEDNTGDGDGDFIPDNIETMLGMDPADADEDSDGKDDGLQSSGSFGDNFFNMQWHLRDYEARVTNKSNVKTEGLEGITDLDVIGLYHHYMGFNSGNPIIVQVVDTGIDAIHEDLIDNMDLSRSYKGENQGVPSETDIHGTMVAGIMASRALNGKGVRGIIPFANISGSDWLDEQTLEALTTVWLTGNGANEIAVSNNSWGSYFDTDLDYEIIMKEGVSKLRDGKGRIYVFAAGNDREDNGNTNLQYMLSNRYAIVVTGVKNDNTHADYASSGANILISGYSGNYVDDSPTIGTTIKMGQAGSYTWDGDKAGNYTYLMNGTSAASPTVAASIALVLEACPALTWRDIRYLLATTARKVDDANTDWINNAAGWHFNINYGFGLVNAKGMIERCKSQGYTVLPTEKSVKVSEINNTVIPDDESVQQVTLNMDDNISVEWVEVTIDNDSPYASDYRIELVSPEGTRVTLMQEGTCNRYDCIPYKNWMEGGFRLSTAAMLDEGSKGMWTVEISDRISGNTGTLKSIELQVYGH